MQEPRNRGDVYGVVDTDGLLEWSGEDHYPLSRESLERKAEYVADNIRDWLDETLDRADELPSGDLVASLCRDLLAALRA